MARFGFCNGTYQSLSPQVDAEECFNWYPENPESPGAKTSVALYPTPGKSIFCTLSGPSVRGLYEFQGRVYAVSGSTFYELGQSPIAGNFASVIGSVVSDNNPVSFAAGPNQILFTSGGTMYVYNFTTGIFSSIPTSTLFLSTGVSQVTYIDGFFVALFSNSNAFQISNLDDATTWPLTNVQEVSVYGDSVTGMVTAYRQIGFLGDKASVFYYDAGTPLTPLSPVSGGFIHQGLVATYSGAFMDNSVFWLGQDERGAGIAWRANGYTPQRVSTFACEYAWSQYPTISDATSYTYQEEGHTFWVLYFPTANATWVYDAASQQWHRRGFWNGGFYEADRSRCHAYGFGIHLVGDTQSGNVYQQSIGIETDFGNQIVRTRIPPTITTELDRIFYHKLQLDCETGLGPNSVSGSGNPQPQQVNMSFSNDCGKSWSNQQTRSLGLLGQYQTRVIWNRLGSARQRTFKITTTSSLRIVDGYIKATPGFDAVERIPAQLRKVS
jgi:hypothetical protein